MPVRARTLAAATLAGLVVAPLAAAQAAPRFGSNKLLWASVNVCDTAAHPNTIGIRGSMPGTASGHEAMYMRFQAQYLSSNGVWHNVPNGDKGFRYAGHADAKARQKGRYVEIKPDPTTDSVLLRGMVTFEWRYKGDVVRRAHRRTHKGHVSKAGADPSDYSAANCTVTK